MPKIKQLENVCQHCKTRFVSKFLSVPTTEVLDGIQMSGNMEQCPSCGKMTPCDRKDMRVILEDGSEYQR